MNTEMPRTHGPDGSLIGSIVPPVRSGNVFEETMEHLVRQLRLGRFPPGAKLPAERELARSLRVSRTSLREVLAQLQEAGYVVVRRGRYGGAYVSDTLPAPDPVAAPDPGEVDDVLTLRSIIEPAAARLAASVEHGPAARESLWEAHQTLSSVGTEQYRPLDSRLHLMIADLAGSPSVTQVVADVRTRLNDLLDCIPLLPPNLAHACTQHEAIVHAILDRRPDEADRLMRDHLDGSAALLRGFLG